LNYAPVFSVFFIFWIGTCFYASANLDSDSSICASM
jgi:hypothetical protein